jgi:hypothetical protein
MPPSGHTPPLGAGGGGAGGAGGSGGRGSDQGGQRGDVSTERASGQYANTAWLPNRRRLA